MLPPLVADINIAVSVIQFLRAQGVDVVAGREESWNRYEDRDILRKAHEMNRFVLTHDSDFSTLAVLENQSITGIIHLRPGSGNLPREKVIADLQVLLNAKIDWTPPLIVVCQSGKPPRLRRLTAIEV
jgi:predicted nuclease of predicted toxin-antitoxin system